MLEMDIDVVFSRPWLTKDPLSDRVHPLQLPPTPPQHQDDIVFHRFQASYSKKSPTCCRRTFFGNLSCRDQQVALSLLQRWWKTHLIQSHFLQLKKTTLFIQDRWRYIKLKSTAVFIKSRWLFLRRRRHERALRTVRKYMLGRLFRRRFLRVKSSVIKIQSICRKLSHRRHLLKRAVLTIEKWWISKRNSKQPLSPFIPCFTSMSIKDKRLALEKIRQKLHNNRNPPTPIQRPSDIISALSDKELVKFTKLNTDRNIENSHVSRLMVKVIQRNQPRPPSPNFKNSGKDPTRFDRNVTDINDLYHNPTHGTSTVRFKNQVSVYRYGPNPLSINSVSHLPLKSCLKKNPTLFKHDLDPTLIVPIQRFKWKETLSMPSLEKKRKAESQVRSKKLR